MTGYGTKLCIAAFAALALALPAGAETGGPLRAKLRDKIAERVQGKAGMAPKRSARTATGGLPVTLGGVKGTVWWPDGQGAAPLVVFSHGLGGCGTQVEFLMTALAGAGYLVVAPDHADARCGGGGGPRGMDGASFRDAAGWSDATYADRRDDMTTVIAALHDDPAFRGRIDWTRVALAGHSLGGYTVLGLAGGWDGWRQDGIGAVLALSPYCAPFAKDRTLSGIGVPVMYQGGTRDIGITPSVKRPGGCFDQTPGPAWFADVEGAGHFAWTNADRDAAMQAAIGGYAVAFLDETLRGKAGAVAAVPRTGVRLRAK